jgi:hypothetical protein
MAVQRPQGEETGGIASRYVEDFFEPRTKLADFFQRCESVFMSSRKTFVA